MPRPSVAGVRRMICTTRACTRRWRTSRCSSSCSTLSARGSYCTPEIPSPPSSPVRHAVSVSCLSPAVLTCAFWLTERCWLVARAGLTLFDSDDAERQSLSRRRVIRTLYPQITEAPLYFYATQADSASIRAVADQCAETGFEAIILSFGSGFNPSSTNASYIAQMAKDVEYVRSPQL